MTVPRATVTFRGDGRTRNCSMEIQKFRKILCANRGEIALRVFRACNELGSRTVAIFSEEDATHQHRYKADEAYLVGQGKKPVEAYLDVDEILGIAEQAKADAIHPGYGFLSEDAEFAAACRNRRIAFIGPRDKVIRFLGDKVQARAHAQELGIPVVPGLGLEVGSEAALNSAEEFFRSHGTVLVKAAHGGGGRGMRVVDRLADLPSSISQASSEAGAAFGNPEVFLEKYLNPVRHIEVQVLGDLAGNLVHLHERDCSVQRRHQKVIEVAPSPNLPDSLRQILFADALKLAGSVGFHNAGTVEFLVHGDEHYFIEVNPRLQVEHTVTEEITGIDIVQAQILIEEGHPLSSPELGIFGQTDVVTRGCAIQCRVTTEDPTEDFLPDTGTILAYRSAGGFGIRLDVGNGYVGAHVTHHYDSLLVKVIAFAPTLIQAARKSRRALREFRIRGVKTNLSFLQNVIQHEAFLNGRTYTRFIDETPTLFRLPESRDRATRLLNYLADVIVNGHSTVDPDKRRKATSFAEPRMPEVPPGAPPAGTVQLLEKRGPEGLAQWVLDRDRPLLTDTTMRDAHQSLLATRVRTTDMLRIANATACLAPDLFSMETWGGATFDVAYRFLHEDPWDRLRRLKKAVPNILQQMLLRGANAVGYTSYPDNVVEAFIEEAALAGVDVFRIFDSLNDLSNMQVAVNSVLRTGKVAEVCLCYTGDVANPNRKKYGLSYYVDLAHRIEDMGAHFLCVKDMAGLLRPQAARMLLQSLKESVRSPIHLHTHDTSGNGVATLMTAVGTGADIVDVALAPMAGLTSQPSMNALIAALRGTDQETGMANKTLQPLADYWENVREFYSPFECGLKSCTSEVYYHEIPGGQYSNLRPQVASMGLLGRWNEVKHAFAIVNALVGDIPKVTPSSKMVGDLAVFLVQNDLLVLREDFEKSVAATRQKVLSEASHLDFPLSCVQYFQGHLGKPPGGFPQDIRAAVLKGLPGLEGSPSVKLEPLDLEDLGEQLEPRLGRPPTPDEVVSAALYPRVFGDYIDFFNRHGDVSILSTPVFFYGLELGQEVWVELEAGKTLVISLSAVSDPHADGTRVVYFTLNGQGRQVTVPDRSVAVDVEARRQADVGNPGEVGAPMPGTVIALHCHEGQKVTEGDALLDLEAMKMETIVRSPVDGTVTDVLVNLEDGVQRGDLMVALEPA